MKKFCFIILFFISLKINAQTTNIQPGASCCGTIFLYDMVSFKWNSVSGATQYRLQVAESNGSSTNPFPWDQTNGFSTGSVLVFNSNLGNVATYSLTSLARGKSYSWSVREDKTYLFSSKFYFYYAPSIPVLNSPGTNVCSPISLSWGTSSGADQYSLQISTSNNLNQISGFSSTVYNQNVGNVTSKSVSLSPGTYYWSVRGGTSIGGGKYATSGSFTVISTPSSPSGVSASAQSTSSILISWNSVSGASSYDVYRNGSYLTNTSSTSYTNSGLSASTNYCYTIYAKNSCGSSSASSQSCTTTNSYTLSINPTTASANATSGTGSTAVTSNISWSASSNQTWLTITAGTSGSNNGTISYSYSANPNTTSRTATITVSGSGVTSKTLTVTQVGQSPSLSINPTTASANATSGTSSTAVTSNIIWTASSNQTWLTITAGTSGSNNGTISYSYSANPNTTSRTATITVSGSGVTSQTLTVTQDVANQTPQFLPNCPTSGNDYCNCNASPYGFNLKIKLTNEPAAVYRPDAGSNIPTRTTFSWQHVIGATNYELYIANQNRTAIGHFPSFLIPLSETENIPSSYNNIPVNSTIFRTLNSSSWLTNNTSYIIKIIAKDNNENIIACNEISFTTFNPNTVQNDCAGYSFGSLKGHFNNIIVCDNEIDDGHATSNAICCNNKPLWHCRHNQCKDYVCRYYHTVYNLNFVNNNLRLNRTARTWDDAANQKEYLEYYSNDGTSFTPPQTGDIFIYDGGCRDCRSHVSLVKSVTNTTISIVQQNVRDGNHFSTLTLNNNNGFFTVTGDGDLVAWLRPKKLKMYYRLNNTDDNFTRLFPDNNSPAYIGNATPTIQWTHVPNLEYKLYVKKKRDIGYCYEQITGSPFILTNKNSSGFSFYGNNLAQGAYLCKVVASTDDNVGTIESDIVFFNITSNIATKVNVKEPNNLQIVTVNQNKKKSSNSSTSSVPNALISKLSNGLWSVIGFTDTYGKLFAIQSVNVGDTIKGSSNGYNDSQIIVNDNMIESGIIQIEFAQLATNRHILDANVEILNNQSIVTENTVNLRITAINYLSYQVISYEDEKETIIVSKLPSDSILNFSLADGLNSIIIRFIGTHDTIEVTKTIDYQPKIDNSNSYIVTINCDKNSINSKMFINGRFIKTLINTSEQFTIPKGINYINFTKDGFSFLGVTVDTTKTIDLKLNALNVIFNESNRQIAKLYPNPTSGRFLVESNENAKNVVIQVYDMQGKLILSKNLDNQLGKWSTEIDIVHCVNALYIVKLQVDDKYYEGKVIKQE